MTNNKLARALKAMRFLAQAAREPGSPTLHINKTLLMQQLESVFEFVEPAVTLIVTLTEE